ncbi:MAG: diguanylate cyclase [Pseudomonadota bacterium]|nr:diguanylate cyclase [Pseudomonadota bacterium]
MEQNQQQAFQEKLRQMQASFIEGLPQRLSDIKDAWQQVEVGDDQESLQLLHRLVHTITGSAGTFSLLSLSIQARSLEVVIKSLLDASQAINEEEKSQIRCMLQTIESEINAATAGELKSMGTSQVQRSRESHEQNKVLIVEDDKEINQFISVQLSHFGYEVQVVTQLEEVNAAIETEHPDLILFDINFPEGSLAGTEKVKEIQTTLKCNAPVIFISSRQDIQARLSAVRAQGQAYFTKPLNISSLLEKVNELTEHDVPEPYHILMVDDDPTIIELATFILRQAGMDATGITNPLETLEKISETKPDLILVDLHMPECTRIELARVIRQHSNLANIPIIFLSSETDSAVQLETALQGGDEFLPKPIKVDELAAFIQVRAKRARELSALMIKDGLTGLYNHTYSKELIDREMERVLRSGSSMSIAMLDVDFFKKVNDTHGHMVGDQVLRSLANYLTKRLRKTDYIGRYGGEEFVVIMPETLLEDAEKVMAGILTSFAYVEHHAPDEDFTVTFSAGLVSSAQSKSTSELMKIADELLYKAKENGRNQVVTA